jgi:hypothetical protein
VDRYSFAVELSHLFLHAGLSRRTTTNEVLSHPEMVLNPPDDTVITRHPLAVALARPGVAGTIVSRIAIVPHAGAIRSTGYRVRWGCWFAGRIQRRQSCVDVDAVSPEQRADEPAQGCRSWAKAIVRRRSR